MSRAKDAANRMIAAKGFALTISATDPDTSAVVDRAGYGVITNVLPHALRGAVDLNLDDEVLIVTADTLPEIGARVAYLDRDRVVAAVTPTMDGSTTAMFEIVARVG